MNLALTVVAWILVLTILLDLVDLRAEIGSFRFAATLNYFVYLFIRVVLAILAAIIIQGSGEVTDPGLLAFVAVVGNFAILQNLTVRFGGEDLINLSAVFERYRSVMVSDEGQREARRQQKETMELVAVIRDLPVEFLSSELSSMYLSAGMSAEQARAELEKLREQTQEDVAFLGRVLATQMVEINPEYVKEGIKEWIEQREDSDPESA